MLSVVMPASMTGICILGITAPRGVAKGAAGNPLIGIEEPGDDNDLPFVRARVLVRPVLPIPGPGSLDQ
jgi:hypothetical protein